MSEELREEARYTLKTPFDYASKGVEAEAKYIDFSAPSAKSKRECAFLRQAFLRASRSLGDNRADAADVEEAKKKIDAEEISGDDVLALIGMSPEVDLADVMDVAARLFTKGDVALVNGEEPLTPFLLGKMTDEDFAAATGFYLANFTLASSLRAMRS